MTNRYHYFQDNRIIHVHDKVVHAIGVDQYKYWKKIEGPMFHVNCSLTAVDLMVHIRADIDRYDLNRAFYNHTVDYWGCTDDYLLVYCLQRGIDFEIKKGEFVSKMTANGVCKMLGIGDFANDTIAMMAQGMIDDRNITGHGPSLIMSLGNLHYELSVALNKTFITQIR